MACDLEPPISKVVFKHVEYRRKPREGTHEVILERGFREGGATHQANCLDGAYRGDHASNPEGCSMQYSSMISAWPAEKNEMVDVDSDIHDRRNHGDAERKRDERIEAIAERRDAGGGVYDVERREHCPHREREESQQVSEGEMAHSFRHDVLWGVGERMKVREFVQQISQPLHGNTLSKSEWKLL